MCSIIVVLAAAAALAACGEGNVKVETNGQTVAVGDLGGKSGGYTFNVFDDGGGAKTFLVIGPDGRQAAAKVEADGAARLVEGGDAHAAMSDAASAMGAAPDDKVSVKVPGMSFNVKADESGEDKRAKVEINVGGKSIQVDAQGPDGSEKAVVKIAGATAEDARKFIDEAHQLTPEVKSAMKAKLGL